MSFKKVGFLDLNYLAKLERLETNLYSILDKLSLKDRVSAIEKLHRAILAREKFISDSTIDFSNPKIELAFTLLLRQFEAAMDGAGVDRSLAVKSIQLLSESLVGFETTLNESLNGVSSQAQLAQEFSNLEELFLQSIRKSKD